MAISPDDKMFHSCRPVLIAGMTVLAALFLISDSAKASCGDYLAGHQNRSVVTDNTNRLSELTNIAGTDLSQGHPQSGPSPCEGGNCDRAPVPDFPLAPATHFRVSDNHNQWGTLPVLNGASKKLSAPWPSATAAFPNRGHHRRVDRPPRLLCRISHRVVLL
jgi:hypothetical protein